MLFKIFNILLISLVKPEKNTNLNKVDRKQNQIKT